VSEITYRAVDRDNQGWHPSHGADGGTVYAADYGFERDLPDRPLDELAATRGPLRPVEPVTEFDVRLLRHDFGEAGRKTITTLAAALETVFHRLCDERDSYQFARRTLMAGREGSWESELLIDVVMFGSGLNHAANPSKRVNRVVQGNMAAMFWRWVVAPDRYTEVAETLASIVSSYCDDQDAGWKAVADQWLQPGALAQADFSTCYRLFYSVSEHFDSGVI
jgi:hypothetical protein